MNAPAPAELAAAAEHDQDQTDPVLEAFRLELRKYIEEPLTAKSLRQIIQLAETGRELLAIRNPRVRRGLRGRQCTQVGYGFNSMNSGYVTNNPGFEDYDEVDEEGEPLENLGAQYTLGRANLDRETFGARILRELVAVIPQVLRASREDQAQLVSAIAAAEREGMPDLAAQLRQRLMPEHSLPPTEKPKAAVPTEANDAIWAARAPDSHEFVVGPAPLNVVVALASTEHEIVNAQTGEPVSPNLLATVQAPAQEMISP